MITASIARVATTICLVLSLALPAAAQTPPDSLDQVEELAQQARQAYKAGRFESAIGFYLRAYRLEPAGALLYNIAYVYDRKLGERDLAVEYYRRYVQASDAEPDVVERAMVRVRELKKRTTRIRVVDDGKDPLPTDGRPGDGNGVGVKKGGGGLSGQALGGWVTFGVGAGALVGWGTMSGLAFKSSRDQEVETDLDRRHSLQDTGETQALVADILLGVGLACTVTGLVLALTASSYDSASGQVHLGGAPIRGGALFTIGGTL